MRPALTYLFVPGDRPERFAKAIDSGADCVILDLEDAVAPSRKDDARRAVADWLMRHPESAQRLLLRINDQATPWHTEDLQLLSRGALGCVMLPKCESAAQVRAVRQALPDHGTVLPLIETAMGVQALAEICAAPGVLRLAFGALDYMLDLDVNAQSPLLTWSAAQIAVASRAAGLPPPVAGVTPELDAQQVRHDLQQARELGFGAKMCIHPMQVAAVREALQPSDTELAWAQRVLAASAAADGAAVQLDGAMVDRPVLLRAQRILARAPAPTSAL